MKQSTFLKNGQEERNHNENEECISETTIYQKFMNDYTLSNINKCHMDASRVPKGHCVQPMKLTSKFSSLRKKVIHRLDRKEKKEGHKLKFCQTNKNLGESRKNRMDDMMLEKTRLKNHRKWTFYIKIEHNCDKEDDDRIAMKMEQNQ